MSNLKLYIAVLDEVPDHMVPVLVAHATLGAHLEFYGDEDSSYKEWLEGSFRKVVLKVSRREFEHLRKEPDVYLAHENTTLNGEKSCIVLCPRNEWPRVVQFAKLWKPSYQDQYARLLVRNSMLEAQISNYEWEKNPGQGAY